MFGLFKPPGKIEIQTDRMSYSFGETIRGKAILTMDSPKKAKAVRLTFFAEREVPYNDSKGNRSTRKQNVYSYACDLDGEREYSGSKEYEFEVKIPAQQEMKMPEGMLGQVAGVAIAAAQMTGMAPGPVRWFLNVSLDIPNAGDVSKQIQINLV
ncbi:MAG: hypothetical protein NT157_03570 [Candidatus Micrarchaeota archaeon]|nr:hypothetical protein [Candidatus Micrarchaeota archaeon]